MQVLPDHRDRVGVGERRGAGEQVKRRRRQRVLVGAAVEVGSDQLLGGRVSDGAHRDVGLGDSADVGELTGNAEVRQQDSVIVLVRVGQQDVGGFDVPVQQTAGVGVVQRARDGGDDRADVLFGHPTPELLAHQPGSIRALDVVHRDPEVAVELAAIVHRDDVRMPQRGSEIGFAVESFAEFRVGCRPFAQDLERVAAWQARVFGEVDVGHPAGSQGPQDGVARERRRGGECAVRRIVGAGSTDVDGLALGPRPDQRYPGQQPGDR